MSPQLDDLAEYTAAALCPRTSITLDAVRSRVYSWWCPSVNSFTDSSPL